LCEKEETLIEKRELLFCLKSKLVLKDKKYPSHKRKAADFSAAFRFIAKIFAQNLTGKV